MKITELNRLYDEADDRSRELFAEMRSNILLMNGNHYARRNSRFWKNTRGGDNISHQQRLRITKNHVQKIIKGYINGILTLNPGVGLKPRNPKEIQDIKFTELNSSVWEDVKRKHKLKALQRGLAKDFCEIGELWCKVFYDENGGKFLGYRKEINEKSDDIKSPEFQGDLVFERHQGFNVLVDTEARSYQEAQWVCFRKMLPIKELKRKYKGDDEKTDLIQKSSKETYKVFDSLAGQYSDVRGLTMIREFYFRPCLEYPKGWYAICAEQGILHEDELPYGIWPIIHEGFDEVSTTPRCYSLIKQLRPNQGEINRTASKIAETQITSDDKVITGPGGSVGPGAVTYGIRQVKVTGGLIQTIPGRTGDQYIPYMDKQISEMYQIANWPEDSEEKQSSSEPWAQLFRAMRDKKRVVLYSDKFAEAMMELAELSLELKRKYIKESELVPIIGKHEFVNIEEFKNSVPFAYQCVVEEQSDDVETKMGRVLTMNHVLQYVGPSMSPEDYGVVVKNMPYVNDVKMFERFTLNEDIVESILLALDRGEYPKIGKRQPHEYIIKRLELRINQNDFQFLDEEVQKNYEKKIAEHEKVLAEQQQQAQQAAQGAVPTGGYLVTCDFYVPNPAGPEKPPKRVRVPSKALEDLLQRLEKQGQAQERLQAEPLSVQADIGGMMGGEQQGGNEAPPDQSVMNQMAMQQ